MDLCEIRIEIPAGRADETDEVLLELGLEGWSLLEDAVARRAWVVGIFANETEAKSRWSELSPLLPDLPLAGPDLRLQFCPLFGLRNLERRFLRRCVSLGLGEIRLRLS